MAAPKRMGWGALLNSVKEKKNKKEHEVTSDDPPAKKLKSEVFFCLYFILYILFILFLFFVFLIFVIAQKKNLHYLLQ